MCGRYVSPEEAAIERAVEVQRRSWSARFADANAPFPASYNVAPTVWLTGTVEDVFAALKPYPSELMVAWPVANRVNSVRNKGAELIQPWEIDPLGSLL